MTKRWVYRVAAAAMIASMVVLTGCAARTGRGTTELATDATTVNVSTGATDVELTALTEALQSVDVGTLDETEAAGLLFMREEEKLARDIYAALYDVWGQNTFQNIGASEQTHTDAVKALLDRYGLPDPVEGRASGEFADAELQALYDDLLAEGSTSLDSALRVGAAVEEIDILDLAERRSQTDEPDIQIVYDNLTKGSRNHLRSFVSVIERRTGETYTPQHLDQIPYDEIVGSDMERGGAQGRGRGRGRDGLATEGSSAPLG